MASHGYVDECPNCGNEDADYCNESRPFTFTTITCSACGFYSIPKSGQMSLEDVNEERENRELEPLESLPPMSEELVIS